MRLLHRLALVVPLAACHAPRPLDEAARLGDSAESPSFYAVPHPQGAVHVQANWKERLAQPYVFVEHSGDYRRLGGARERLLAETKALGLSADGPPFALFYDDPGIVPVPMLRARACFPVSERPDRLGALRFDVLPRAMVAYARIPGPKADVSRSYKGLFSYLHDLGWTQGGPVREIYLVDALGALDPDELLTEVQIPWASGAD